VNDLGVSRTAQTAALSAARRRHHHPRPGPRRHPLSGRTRRARACANCWSCCVTRSVTLRCRSSSDSPWKRHSTCLVSGSADASPPASTSRRTSPRRWARSPDAPAARQGSLGDRWPTGRHTQPSPAVLRPEPTTQNGHHGRMPEVDDDQFAALRRPRAAFARSRSSATTRQGAGRAVRQG
jgi:hypothetical protein